ncbi:unnamed protein product [Durusdinium trenchii]|uniref:Uncharacterized protein n=1 Tax=Durusdinium trenchii TaxID=1381693 RepID=A0ABP0P1L9_9DINO
MTPKNAPGEDCEAWLNSLSVPELRKALEAECRISAALRADLQRANEEIETLRGALGLVPRPEREVPSPDKVDRRENGDADLEDPKIASVEGDALAESETADTAVKGSYVKVEGKVYWVSYEDPEQLIRLPNAGEADATRPTEAHEMERSRRLSAEQFLPTTPESQQPRAMRPASSDPRCSVAQRHFQGFALRPTVYASVPASARRSLPPRVAVHGLPRQASSGQFPSGALSQQSSTGSLSQSGHTPRRVLQATTSYSNLPRHSGQVRTPLAGRFQPVSAMTQRYFPSHGAHHVKPAQPHVQQGQPPVHLLPARPKLRQPQDELVNLQSHLKRLQDLQTQLEQQLGDVQQ